MSWCKLTTAANDDALTISYRSTAPVDILANDVTDGTFNKTTLDLIPGTAAVDAVYTDGNGVTYTANPSTGIVSFTNPNKYVGASTLNYLIKDNTGQPVTASLDLTLTNGTPEAVNHQVSRSYSITTPINLLTGVSDVDGNSSIVAASVDLNPSLARRQATYVVANQGTFTIDDNGLVSFAPLNGFVGTSVLSYTVQDEKGLTSTPKQLTLTTTSAAPVAVNDVATRSNTTKAPIYILPNDSDADDDLDIATVDLNPATPARDLTYTDGTKGTYTVDDNGLVSFAAINNFTGTSTVSYLVRDAKGLASNTATLTLTVTQTLANDDTNVTPKGTVASGNVLINDNNRAGTSLSVSTTPVTAPAHGTVAIQANGDYTYTPAANYVGNDSFVYRATDGSTNSNGTVTILVYDPATACTEATGPNLLKNPSFALGNTGFQTDYTYVENQPNITTELNPEGLYAVGTSASDYHGNFIQNGRGGATDNFLMINGSNTIKKLYSQTIAVEPNKYYSFSAYVNNIIKGSTATTADDPVFGFVINGASTSGITSIPEDPDTWVKLDDIWFSGNNTTATFEIVNVSIAAGGNDMGIDDVYFGTCNEAPVAVNDLVMVPSTIPTSFPVITNDVDDGGVQGNTLLLYNADGSGAGTKTLTTTEGSYSTNANTGMVTFTPANGFTGSSVIRYKGYDGASAVSNMATVTVRVGPVAAADVQNMTGQRVATLNVTANDQDVDGVDPSTVDLDPSTPAQDLSRVMANVGVFQVDGTGVVSFTPVSTFSGNASIPYSVKDYVGATSNNGIISITLDRPLPVQLTRFEAKVKEADVHVSWTTAMELKNERFEVERSLDGRTFTRIGSVAGRGTTNQSAQYSYLDAKARRVAPLLYYRLRQVDTNGEAEYSDVQTVRFAEKSLAPTFNVSPNPATNEAALDLTTMPIGSYSVQVLDMTGRVLYSGAAEGGKISPLALHQISSGVYVVLVHNSTTHATKRIVKQ
ncbi:Ig-like domain-containing protein [Hymenobacter sp. DG01]|uniref:Ig-like domain-containing protein n=1 Tax=Hymenobacter sp. DG01 TaxID=2584940 RepID=UPI0015DE9899|nr:tandem-95 repeat protein [Hymenobacter sp. DG01]